MSRRYTRPKNGRRSGPKNNARTFFAELFPTVALTGAPLDVDDDALNALLGIDAPGMRARNCESCNAVLRVGHDGDGVWHMTVMHDEDCAYLAHYRARVAARRSGEAAQ
jgi:hypothetical protein